MKRMLISISILIPVTLLYQEAGKIIALHYGFLETSYIAALFQQLILLLLVASIIVVSSRYTYLHARRISNPIWLLALIPLPFVFLYSGPTRSIPLAGYVEIVTMTALVAINEEVVFRGFLHDYLRPAGERAACIYGALVFSLFHIPNGYSSFFLSFFIALLFCRLKDKFDCLWPLVVAHALINFATFVTRDDAHYYWLAYLCAIIYIVFILLLLSKAQTSSMSPPPDFSRSPNTPIVGTSESPRVK